MKRKYLLLSATAMLVLAVFISSFNRKKQFIPFGNTVDTTAFPSFAMAKDHKGVNVVKTSGFITFTSGLDNDYFQLDSTNRRGYLYIEAKMDRFVNESAKKIPLNLSIVIDRSGSMAGEKMEFAKKAAKDILDKLSPDDFVSVVVYDELIDVIQTAVPVLYKDSIKTKIDKVRPRGSTNLWGGSERGYEQVKANYKRNYVNRVLLISDGLANAGMTNPLRIKTLVQEFKDIEGISISTFGVGLDYNETLMTDMAENGAGNYYFIDKADKMAAMFEKELNGLQNVVAQNAELRITLPRGVSVSKVYPFKYELVKNEVVIKFRDLFSEESKGLMLQFTLDDNVTKELTFHSKLVYTDVVDNQQKVIENENLLLPIKNIDAYLTHFNKTVAEQVVLFTANENMEMAMAEADRGNFESAKRYANSNAFYFKTNAKYVANSGELRRMDSASRTYFVDLERAKDMSADSLKMLQKQKKAMNYEIRNKKQ
ncbi:MAG TPA: VWA domain-containing protein [Flavisolibacter sp.]|nr:VWA domain-containing protein [Flavisolibacter sp.]